jgi:hypothetical protein
MNFARYFVDRPILAAVLSIIIFASGVIAIPLLPLSEYPDVVPPTVSGARRVPRRQPEGDCRDRGNAAGRGDQRRREHDVHEVVAGSDGVLWVTMTFRPGTDPDIAQVQVQNRVNQALPRLPEDVRRMGVSADKMSRTSPWWCISPPRTGATTPSICATTPPCACSTSSVACRASARPWCGAPATTPCACGSTPTGPLPAA